jgi:very-short-patch-repair endonuclease
MVTPRGSGDPWTVVRALAEQQRGLVTRTQWLAAGLDPTQVRRAVAGGRWQRLVRGVYLVHGGEATPTQRQLAALLYAGPRSQLTSRGALVLYRVRYLPADDGLVHVLVPATSGLTGGGFVRVHRTHHLPRARLREGLDCSPVEQAALLLCRDVAGLQDVRALLSELVQRKLTTVGRLSAALERAPSDGSALARRVLGELAAGCRSAPECELRDIVLASRLLAPGVRWNHRVRAGGRWYVADACWPHLRLIVEVDSIEHHGLGDGPEYAARRRLALTVDGWTVVSVSPRRIRQDAAGLIAELEALHTRLSRGLA